MVRLLAFSAFFAVIFALNDYENDDSKPEKPEPKEPQDLMISNFLKFKVNFDRESFDPNFYTSASSE